ncbi:MULTISPECIES: hypothetical protein [unclassified Tolypothrix]|uniref:hypothetical protein n=1 Tax=unclassified Tolypothrix TaxID=2649714 RepID=UPI0005EAB000|nr:MULTISPECIES: hypothetical protein [unclassified Tolypothrix]BAY93126.1 hypothetical protein NIES3275_51630 [Microchaete diplosiphon NIES-3275]EKF00381.1 hypothetical protein FDUTEX481_09042 [Tolypothrix sp. PCC 7601]MBE9081853.1 hypothetical protein [Tolypothrix sp. LEGE 11397]UYD27004.1 hypothetical protein HGR01_02525 [Tolypothrix sp. PCC 7712]UYD37138.1 hypothetical protein HG267_16265 [Tolypothrix sp. PCC 7601]
MFNNFREIRYQQGCRDRDAGLLPKIQDSAYLEAYLKGRPEGLDGIMQYFPSVEAYMKWKFKDLGRSVS